MHTCSSCKHFEPDIIGFGQGIGKCALLEAYKLKIAEKDSLTWNRLVDKANRQLDCHLKPRWPEVERNCQRFEAKA